MAAVSKLPLPFNRNFALPFPHGPRHDRTETSAVILSIYEGLLESSRWRHTLDLIGQYLEASSVTLVVRPSTPDDSGALVSSHTLDASGEPLRGCEALRNGITERYTTHYYQFDPFLDLPLNQVVTADEFLGERLWLTSRLYRDLLEPVQVRHMMGANLATAAGTVCRLRVSRLSNRPPFDEHDKSRLAMLLPHFRQAITLAHHIDRTATERELYDGALDRLNIATIVLDETGKILRTNDTANNLLQSGDGLREMRCRLEARNEEDTQKLQQLIMQAQADGGRQVHAMSLVRRSSERRLGMVIRGVPQKDDSEGKGHPATAIFLRDPDVCQEAPREIVRRLFGFSPAEARLAIELVNGLSLDEAALALGIRRNTARAQLRSIFSKTGVGRQTELLRVLLNGVIGLTRPD